MTGYIYALLYVITCSVSYVWLYSIGKNISIAFLLLFASSLSAIIYHAASFKRVGIQLSSIRKSPVLWLRLSCAFCMMWWLSYYAAVHGSPRLSLALLFVSQSVASSIATRRYVVCAISIGIWAVLVKALPEATVLTTVGGTLAGVFCYRYIVLTTKFLKRNKLQNVDVLVVRSYSLIAFSLFYCLTCVIHKQPLLPGVSLTFALPTLLFFSLANMILPSLLAQLSFSKINPDNFSDIIVFTPALTFILEIVFYREWSSSVVLASIGITLTIFIFKIVKRRALKTI